MMCSCVPLPLVLLLVLLPWAVIGAPQLRFQPDGTLKIVQLTDLHYGEDPHLDSLSDQVLLPVSRPLALRQSPAKPACGMLV
jgi:hypothetical protein